MLPEGAASPSASLAQYRRVARCRCKSTHVEHVHRVLTGGWIPADDFGGPDVPVSCGQGDTEQVPTLKAHAALGDG